MTTETKIRRVLQQAAATIPDDDGSLEQVIRQGRHRGHRHRGTAVAAVAGLVVTVVLAGVALDLPGSLPSATQAPTERTDVVIYLCDTPAVQVCDAPATDAQIDLVRAALAVDEAVAEVRHETQQQAYERFSELFADQPELVESVPPDALPASLRVTLVDDADIDNVVRHYGGFDGVEAVAATDAD